MIDEAYMLTGHAFNAMLKTLGAAEHVKFIPRHHRPAEDPGHGAVALPAVQPQTRCRSHASSAPDAHPAGRGGGVQAGRAASPRQGGMARCATRCRCSTRRSRMARAGGRRNRSAMLRHGGDDHLHAVLDALAANDVPALAVDGMGEGSLSFDAALQALATLVHRSRSPVRTGGDRRRNSKARASSPTPRASTPSSSSSPYQVAVHGRDDCRWRWTTKPASR